jgi:hypothetical protein
MIFHYQTVALAGSTDKNKTLYSHALALKLSHSPAWHKLLHYESDFTSDTGVRSAIHSDIFFLSPKGKTDPTLELKATLKALLTGVKSGDPNSHARCRFPARALWLKNKLGVLDKMVDTKFSCPEFESWTSNESTESISLVFATGYLGNPASYYGHTLLKLNSSLQNRQTSLLDVSLNFGAIVPPKENPVSYIIKGVSGGYDGGFSHIEYYFHTQNYGENELRDLWEYKLDLPQASVDLIVAHMWEILGKKYTYYFFRKNCAYRIAELIEVINNIDIIPNNPLFTMPQSLITNINTAEINGHSLVSEVIYHPSRQTRLYQRYEKLTKQQQTLLTEWVEAMDRGQKHDPIVDYDILDTLLDYYQFVLKADPDRSEEIKEAHRQVLAQRYRLPPHPRSPFITPKLAPHQSRNPSRIGIGTTYSSSRGKGVEIHIRPAYYDPLDSDDTHVSNSALSMGELTVQLYQSEWIIDRFDLVSITNANTRVTGLPGDQSEAWMLRGGLIQESLSCSNCLISRAEGAWGYAYRYKSLFDVTGMVGGTVQGPLNNKSLLYGLITGRLLTNLSPRLRAQWHRAYRVPVFKKETTKIEDTFELAYQLREQNDIRFKLKTDNDVEQATISLGFYW